MLPNPHEIHIWHINLNEAPTESNHLSPDERDREARFKYPHHRDHFANGRNTLRCIIGDYLQVHPTKLTFSYGPYGKPSLNSPDHPSFFFNVSHSGSIMLAAFSTTSEVGIDVEKIRKNDDEAQIVKRFFNASEQEEYLTLPAELRTQAFFNAWTRKEAFVKTLGNGLQTPLDSFSVSIDPRSPCKIVKFPQLSEQFSNWSLTNIKAQTGYTAALAAKSSENKLINFEFNKSKTNLATNRLVYNQSLKPSSL